MSSLKDTKTLKGSTGRLAEHRTAKRMGGKLTPASGALQGAKGDFLTPEFLVENKSTQSESLSLKLDWLLKISQEAVEKAKEPALSIQFTTGDGRPVKNGSYVLVPERVFNEFFRKY